MITTHQIPVPANLSHVVAQYNLYRFNKAESIHLLPEGKAEIIFQLNGPFYQKLNAEDEWKLRPKGFVGGLHNQSYFVKCSEPGQYCLGIKLQAESAHLILPCKLSQLKNSIISISEIFGEQCLELEHNIYDTKCLRLQLKFINQWLHEQGLFSMSRRSLGLDVVEESNGWVPIHKLAKLSYYSESRFRKVFRENIGLSPREYCKIWRVNRAVNRIKKGQQTLKDIAYDLGYYDPAHFNKEIRSITTLPPSAFLPKGSIYTTDH